MAHAVSFVVDDDDEGVRDPAVNAFGHCPACGCPNLIHDNHGCGALGCNCPSIDRANEQIDQAVEDDQRRRGGAM